MLIYLSVITVVAALSCGEIIGVQVDNSAAEITACNAVQCNQTCIAVHFNSGFCKDGQCWCKLTRESDQQIEQRVSEIQSNRGTNDCLLSECKSICEEAGWPKAECINEECWCVDDRGSGRIQKPISEVQSPNQGCKTENCTLQCQGRRYNGGICKNQQCTCWKTPQKRGEWVPMNDLATNYKDKSGNEVDACTEAIQCLEACEHHKAEGGFCLKRVCWCTAYSMSSLRKGLMKLRVRPISEIQGNITGNAVEDKKDTCKDTDCNRLCRNNNDTKIGVCLYGYCWCSNTAKRATEPEWRKLSEIPL